MFTSKQYASLKATEQFRKAKGATQGSKNMSRNVMVDFTGNINIMIKVFTIT